MRTQAEQSAEAIARIATGSTQLDSVLGGGFPANSINILMGEPGSGKTILAERLMFANARRGDRPILYLATLSEPLEKVVRYLQQFSFFDESLLGECILYDSIGDALVEHGAGVLVPRIKEAIVAEKPKVVVIDSFKALHDLGTSTTEMRRPSSTRSLASSPPTRRPPSSSASMPAPTSRGTRSSPSPMRSSS